MRVYAPVCVHTCACVCTLVRVYAPVRECARVPVHVPTACIARGHSAPLIAPFLPGVPPAGPGGLGSWRAGFQCPSHSLYPRFANFARFGEEKGDCGPWFPLPS